MRPSPLPPRRPSPRTPLSGIPPGKEQFEPGEGRSWGGSASAARVEEHHRRRLGRIRTI